MCVSNVCFLLVNFVILTLSQQIINDGHGTDFKNHVLNKCSDDLVIDTLELPESWVGSLNKSQEEQNDWIRFQLVGHDPCVANHSRVRLAFENSTTEYFTHNGYFQAEEMYYPPNAYCIYNATADMIEIQICVPNCSEDVCIHKCCRPGEVVINNLEPTTQSYLFSNCSNAAKDWSPFLYRLVNDTDGETRFENVSRPVMPFYTVWSEKDVSARQLVGWSSPHPKAIREFSYDLRLLESGDVYIQSKSDPQTVWPSAKRNSFCIDGLLDISATGADVFIPEESNQVMWDVPGGSYNNNAAAVLFTALACLGFTSFCLFITVVVYALVWDKQNVHGWTITALCFTLMADWMLLCVGLAIAFFKQSLLGTPSCKIMGVLWHFFELGSYAWVSVLSFDMWTTIKTMTAFSQRSKGKKRFALYCCYGFGVPAVVVAISVAIEFAVPATNLFIVRPEYGIVWCGLGPNSKFYYATVMSMISYALNIIFAVMVFKTLREMSSGSQRADQSSTKQKKSMGVLLAKLSVLMGLPILLKCLLIFLGGEYVKWLQFILGLVEVLQGVAISWIFITDKKIKTHLLTKFPLLRGKTLSFWSSSSSRTTGTTTSMSTINSGVA